MQMPQFSGITDIAHSIQLAVAPVFLLSAVGAFLTVLTNRLGRIIDRARVLDGSSPQTHGRDGALVKAELRYLSARARFVHYAITLSTSCALIITLLIVVLFIAALSALISALIFFLLEIQSATSSLRFSA